MASSLSYVRIFALVGAMSSPVACGSSVLDDPNCEANPDECDSYCGDAGCEGECGPFPEGADCIDQCGNFSSPYCSESGDWVCSGISDEECNDLPTEGDHGSAVWSMTLGSKEFENAADIAMDSQGNVLIIGAYRQTLTFDDAEYPSADGYDIFIGKIDPMGVPLWLVRRGDLGDELGLGIAVDGADNIVILGTDAATSSQPAYPGEVFLAKLDPDGAPQWEVDFEQTAALWDVDLDPLAVDSAGNITIVDWAPLGALVGGEPMPADGAFVTRFDPDGQHVWTTHLESADPPTINAVASDDAGTTFITGTFGGDITIGGTTLTASDVSDGLLLALDAAGALTWSHVFAGAGSQRGAHVAADGVGGVALTGAFETQIDLAGQPLAALGGALTGFVAHFDATGAHSWSHAIAGASNEFDLYRWRVAVHAGGEVMLGGHFEGTSSIAEPSDSAGDSDIFLARFAASGELRWAWSFGDSNSDYLAGIATGPNQNTAIVGKYWGGFDVGNEHFLGHTQGGIFVAMFDEDGVQP